MPDSTLFTTEQVARELNIAPSTFRVLQHRNKATFPQPSYRVPGRSLWTAKDVNRISEWMTKREEAKR